MHTVAKINQFIPRVELISFSLVSNGFFLLFFFFPLVALHVFTLFRLWILSYGPTQLHPDWIEPGFLFTYVYHCAFDAFFVAIGKIFNNLLLDFLAKLFELF